jgi:Fe-S-cluster containining protein
MTPDQTVEKIAQEARASISDFCIEECHAYCCRKGYLLLTPDQVDLVTQNQKEALLLNKNLKALYKGDFSLNLGESCPSLKDDKCMIHKDPRRPETCAHFPLFIQENVLIASPRCLAVKQGKLYPYISQLLKMGFKLKD